jgi:hypothetical protein
MPANDILFKLITPPNQQQLRSFLPTQDLINQFELLFQIVAYLQLHTIFFNEVVFHPPSASIVIVKQGKLNVWEEIILTANIAALTIVLPASGIAINGQLVRITSTHTITTTTVTATGSTVLGGNPGLSASNSVSYLYSSDNNTWYLT